LLRDQFPHRADRVHRIYNGLDLAEFRRADFSSTPPLIIAVGRLIPKKGFAVLIRACALLVERGNSFRCEITGEGPLESELRQQINELCLQNSVVLTGAKPQRELRVRLAAGNVFVLPSVIDPDGGMDNLPTVIMEAMATALPVVSTNVAGIPEMVIENETGFLVQSGDAAAMANAIETVINDRSSAARLGDSGYKRARALFPIENNVRELCALLNGGSAD
jgi:glycosyltransferase involved in cell wall biosynthesis